MLFLLSKTKGVGELIYPSIDQFIELSRNAKLVPVALEMDGDLKPDQLVHQAWANKTAIILESVEGGHIGLALLHRSQSISNN